MRICNNAFYKIPVSEIGICILINIYFFSCCMIMTIIFFKFSYDIAMILFFLMSLIIPLGTLIYFIISRNSDNKKFNSQVNLKSVDIEPSKINFNFNYPQYNFICKYDEIENMEVILYTSLYKGSYVVSKIKLNFTLSNGKIYSILNIPFFVFSQMNLLYLLIDAGRKVQKFSYKFAGAGIDEITKEKLEFYQNRGFKLFLSNIGKSTCQIFSILLFVIGVIVIFIWLKSEGMMLDDIIENPANPIIIFSIMLFVSSFALDIVLFADWLYRKKHNI